MTRKRSLLFRISDLKAPDQFTVKLRDARDPLSKYLRDQCSSATRQLLDEYQESSRPSEALQRALIDELNRVLQGDCLYNDERFMEVPWPGEIRKIIEQTSEVEDPIHLNRLLLEEAYPLEMLRHTKRRSFLRKLLYGKLWPARRLTWGVARHLEYKVAAGVCRGMLYYPVATCGNPANKLMGTFEKELFPHLAALDSSPPRVIFNVGAAEGYYAVGLARRWRGCEVYAWEMNETSRLQIRANATLNDVERRIHVRGVCNEEELHASIAARKPNLVIMDVEGAEIDLCSDRCIHVSPHTRWVVESHRDNIARTLSRRFSDTHRVTVVKNEPRTPADIPIRLPGWCLILPFDRWRLIDEGRPFLTPWIVATPKSASN